MVTRNTRRKILWSYKGKKGTPENISDQGKGRETYRDDRSLALAQGISQDKAPTQGKKMVWP